MTADIIPETPLSQFRAPILSATPVSGLVLTSPSAHTSTPFTSDALHAGDVALTPRNVVAKSKAESRSASSNTPDTRTYTLHGWWVRLTETGLQVEGLQEQSLDGEITGDKVWHSSIIIKRLDARRVQSKSGSIYHLSGTFLVYDCDESMSICILYM